MDALQHAREQALAAEEQVVLEDRRAGDVGVEAALEELLAPSSPAEVIDAGNGHAGQDQGGEQVGQCVEELELLAAAAAFGVRRDYAQRR